MITSKQIISVSEEYFTRKNVSGKDVVIYKNPTYDDIKEIVRLSKSPNPGVRFIADGNKPTPKFYIWDSFLATHVDVFDLLRLSGYRGEQSSTVIFGECYIVGNKLNIPDFLIDDALTTLKHWAREYKNPQFKKKVDDFFNCDWSFIHPYMPRLSDEIKRIKYDFYRK